MMITMKDVMDKFNIALQAGRVPDEYKFPKYRKGDIIDEEQSVKWNREEVERRNEARYQETLRLRAESDRLFNVGKELAVAYIEQETSLNNAQAKLIWNRVYDNYHSCFNDLFAAIDEYIDFYNELINAGKEEYT